MSAYARRAPFYAREFAVRDDFTLLGRLLADSDGSVIDIPSGAGRLLPVHQAHGRDVIMVDIEPAMVGQCRARAAARNLGSRVTAMQGDITTWRTPRPAARLVVARGGLQMLPSQAAVTQALTASAANLDDRGILYLDVAMPWTAAPAVTRHLPPFMRFARKPHLAGSSYIKTGDTRIRRTYTSRLLNDRVTVHLKYEMDRGASGGWQDFETDASWCRVDAAGVLSTLKDNGLKVVSLLGDYAGTAYTAQSARFICLAIAT
ncbi:MAG TPA: class I SAM-dependent methyltransferase [Streptosporangiaceae bacterium]|nr:class I SAM-dependent methyltransferase [Streptosporangiaceae bacterium]HVB44679.1 class I SAM-dependent methyltransferase [Streptosporangiaceae bacterium]